jgi:hypothetical protein
MERAYHAAERPQTPATVVPMGTRRGISQPEDRHQERRARRPFLLSTDMVLVRNDDNVTWRFKWERKHYDVPPNHTLPVPFPAVVNMLGDPRSAVGETIRYRAETGEHGLIPSRYDTLAMLFAHYGIRDESVEALVDFAPKVTVTTMTGEPVIFPAQNPEMDAFPVPQVAEPGREQPIDTRGIIERYEAERDEMRGQLDRMEALVNQKLGGGAAPAETEPMDVVPGAQPDPGPRTGI